MVQGNPSFANSRYPKENLSRLPFFPVGNSLPEKKTAEAYSGKKSFKINRLAQHRPCLVWSLRVNCDQGQNQELASQ
jgi:hypothetical protein